MAFDEIQFDTEISYGATGGPTFSTTVISMATGFEQRNQNWERARGRWRVGHNLKFDAELSDLISFFRSRRGRARGFRFKDWSDYTATLSPIGTGDGANDTFQLVKVYEDDLSLNTYTRTITKPVSGTVRVFVNAVEQTIGSDFTVDTTTGIVTFTPSAIPGAGTTITATFEFDTPARFDEDQMNINLVAFDSSNWEGIQIAELPETTTT